MLKRKLSSGDSVGVRSYREEDKNFLMSSWLRSFKSSRYAGPIPNNMYWKVYAEAIEQLLCRDGVKVVIACNPKKEAQIFGYIVVEENHEVPVVHWLYVKQSGFRGWGIARMLMDFCGVGRETTFYYTYKSSSAPALTSQVGPWPNGKHRDSIARKKRRLLDETTGYLVQGTSEVHQRETAE